MRITVKSYNEIRAATRHLPGGSLEVPDGTRVASVLALLPLPAGQKGNVLLFVNGRPADRKTVLQEGDALVLFPAVAGG